MQGAAQLRQAAAKDALLKKCTVFIFIIPPSLDELARRLRARGTETEEVIQRRLEIAEREFQEQSSYDHVIRNDNLEQAIAEFREILRRERTRQRTATRSGQG